MIINILNEGQLPVFNKVGPLFGVSIFSEMYGVLKNIPSLDIEITTVEEAEIKKQQYYANKNKSESVILLEEEPVVEDAIVITVEEKAEPVEEVISEEVAEEEPVEEDLPKIDISAVFEPAVEIDEFDSAIDNILDDSTDNTNMPCKLEGSADVKIRKYRESTLQGMKKKDLAKILVDRGYEVGKFSPKYYDTAEKLIAKILKTQ